MGHWLGSPLAISSLLPRHLLGDQLLELVDRTVAADCDGEATPEAIVVHLLVAVVNRDTIQVFALL